MASEAGSFTDASKMAATSYEAECKELLRLVEQRRLELVAANQASASGELLLFQMTALTHTSVVEALQKCSSEVEG